MSSQNPFDFSDFGPPPTPKRSSSAESRTPGGSRQPAPDDVNLGSGFDPFANVASPSGTSRQDAFGGGDTTLAAPGLAVAHPPLALFILAAGLAAVGIVTAAVWGAWLAAAAVGWLLAGPIAIGVLAYYTRVDTRRRSDAVYSAPAWTASLYRAVVALCLIGISVGAWHLALWAGQR
jgi:hypothetical protein